MKSKKILVVLMAIIVILLAMKPVGAAITELWNRTYDGGIENYDRANGVATDASGNVIVTGTSVVADACSYYYTIKYDEDGNVVWSRSYDGGPNDRANGVATDASGNVIVTGAAGGDYYTIKYDEDGDVVWSRSYDGGYEDRANGVATDASGNVIVTGTSVVADGRSNYYTIKYDEDGNVVWSRSYDGGPNDQANGVATDAAGNVIVTGDAGGDYYTIKYDKDGNVVWSRSYDGGYDGWANGVATDAAGNVIVTGAADDWSNYYTIKYDKDGNVVWSRSYDGGYYDRANGVATDASGNVIVTGAAGGDYYTIKYDEDGNVVWSRSYDGGYYDRANGVATDASGNVIVTGLSADFEETCDYYTIKYGGDVEAQPLVASCDDSGAEQNTFDLSEDAYCRGENLAASTSVDIYVVNNKDVWKDGDALTDVSGGYETETTGDDGSIATTLIWRSPLTTGSYDIVVDTNQNGEWNKGDPIDDIVNVGFEAVPEFTTIAIPVVTVLGLMFLISRRKQKR